MRQPVITVVRGVSWAAVFLCGIGTAVAQDKPDPTPDPTQDPKPAAQEPKKEDPKPDGFTMGGFTFKPGGRIKLDIIRDFNPIGSEDSFDPRTIPLPEGKGGNSNLHAKETRLTLDMRGPVEGKELRMYVETDFYGSSSVLRLRQAYGSYGGLLAGQAWSTFVDDNNFPNTIDFESPMAFPSIRQAQLRWTQKVGTKTSWSAAIEDNKSQILLPVSLPGKAEYPMPDLVGRVIYTGSRGHVFASGFVGQARFRPTDGEAISEPLWGMLLSTRIKTVGKDVAYAQYTFGDGVGRYRGAITAFPDGNGGLHAGGLQAVTVGYDHYWTPVLSSNVVLSQTAIPKKDFYPADTNHELGYNAVNLLYWFIKDRAWAGVEYLHGRREIVTDESGKANRLQFAVRFNFPS